MDSFLRVVYRRVSVRNGRILAILRDTPSYELAKGDSKALRDIEYISSSSATVLSGLPFQEHTPRASACSQSVHSLVRPVLQTVTQLFRGRIILEHICVPQEQKYVMFFTRNIRF